MAAVAEVVVAEARAVVRLPDPVAKVAACPPEAAGARVVVCPREAEAEAYLR